MAQASISAPRPGATAENIIQLAKQFVGGKYVWGGSSPSSGGFDCSGLVQYVFSRHGIHLPRVAEDQYQKGIPVRYEDLQPGDLVFQANTYKSGISHVALYIGEGKILHAKGRNYGIVIDSITRFSAGHPGARRILNGGEHVASSWNPQPKTQQGVAFRDFVGGIVGGNIRLTVGHDPLPHDHNTEYAIEIDGEEAVCFPEAGVILRFDTKQLADGEHVMKLVRRNRATGARFITQTVNITSANH